MKAIFSTILLTTSLTVSALAAGPNVDYREVAEKIDLQSCVVDADNMAQDKFVKTHGFYPGDSNWENLAKVCSRSSSTEQRLGVLFGYSASATDKRGRLKTVSGQFCCTNLK